MEVHELLDELYERIPEVVRSAVHGLSVEQLTWAPVEGANTVGWLVWHLTRVQDSHVAELLDAEQVWVSGDWGPRFGLDGSDPGETGYGYTPQEVAAVRPRSAKVLVEYHEAVARRTGELLRGLKAGDLDRIVDERFDPPVSLGVRLVSIADDDLQHAGQAAYVRGLLRRSGVH